MILVAYRHGLRASELVDLRWDQVDFNQAALHVRRVKQGTPATHPILGDELRALRQLQREQEPRSPFVFTIERGSPFTTSGFAKLVERAGEAAGLGFPAHPHMLRHACGFALANKGTIPGRCRPIWATRTSSTRCATPSSRPVGSRIFGEADGGQITPATGNFGALIRCLISRHQEPIDIQPIETGGQHWVNVIMVATR